MGYSVEILNEIESMANSLTTIDDIATILEIEPIEFKRELKVPESEAYKAFYKGFLLRVNAVNKCNLNPVDVDGAEFTAQQIKNYRLKIIIELENA
jgi:hypothetical protein